MHCCIEKIHTKIRSLSLRHWGMIFTAICVAVIASVFISQYGFGLQPCELCLYQRIPFYIGLALSLGLVAIASRPRFAYVFLALLALCFLASTALATFHLGVEYKWWPYNSGCTASIFGKGSSTADLLAALKAAPVIKCDDRVEFLFGMTMAFYNILTSAFLLLVTLGVAWCKRGLLCVGGSNGNGNSDGKAAASCCASCGCDQ